MSLPVPATDVSSDVSLTLSGLVTPPAPYSGDYAFTLSGMDFRGGSQGLFAGVPNFEGTLAATPGTAGQVATVCTTYVPVVNPKYTGPPPPPLPATASVQLSGYET